MTVTWNIVVTRKDGTRLPLSSQTHDRDPRIDTVTSLLTTTVSS
jgi:hypothetical protein